MDYIPNTASITEGFLASYRSVLQLDLVPYGWKPEAMAAYKSYIESVVLQTKSASVSNQFDLCRRTRCGA